MKPIPCPRCNGSGVIEETETLIGIAPLLDRPSVVNDEEWTLSGRDAADSADIGPTVVTDVPTFKLPSRPQPPTPKVPQRDSTRIASEAELPTPNMRRRSEVFPPRRRWFLTTATVVLSLVIGMAAGGVLMLHKDAVVPWVEHALRGHR